MIARIYCLFLLRCSISVESIIFLRTIILSERKHLSILVVTARAQNNSSCVLGMRMSVSDNFLMAESSIWWVVLSDITNAFYDWELLMGFHV